MNKSDLYKLIDALPEKEIPTAAAFLSFVTHQSKQTSTDDFFDSAPYDDEEYPEEELAIIDERIREAQSGGETIPFAQVKANHGLT